MKELQKLFKYWTTIEVDGISRWGTDGNPQEDKARPGAEQWKYVPGTVELAAEEFAEKIWPTESLTLVEVFFEFISDPDEF